jgi:cystathionine beta-lyase/cystathionine gamma-synthase
MQIAAAIAHQLEASPEVKRVIYPRLSSYPHREVAERLLPAEPGGAMISFVVAGGDERARRLMRHLTLATEATSLGGVETLISAPFNSSHYLMSPGERAAIGIEAGMLRLSVGLEEADGLIADFETALRATASPRCSRIDDARVRPTVVGDVVGVGR